MGTVWSTIGNEVQLFMQL